MTPKVSETCTCGANFGYEGFGALAAVREWREIHQCAAVEEEIDPPQHDSHLFAQAERTEDMTLPEMHIGFRPNYLDEE